MRILLCALLLAAAEAQLPENQFVKVKSDAECNDGPNTKLGNVATAAHCAEKCQQYPGCVFFIMGKGSKGGWCWKEDTNTSSCVEGWEVDMYDFYQLQTPGVAGCMEPKAPNYNPAATREKSPSDCQAADTCFQRDPNTGECHNCAPSTCETGNDGYRNAKNDTVKASKVEKGTITVDGDLRDWTDHDKDRCYQDVAFAREDGQIVVFEEYSGGKWFGPSDFSNKWMMRWDDDFVYLAIDVTDDKLQVSSRCLDQGLQVAFEVAGPGVDGGAEKGALQDERSPVSDVSRLQLLNVGLKPGQTSCSTDLPFAQQCCVDYERTNNADINIEGNDGWVRYTKVAVLRNENTKLTTFEAAFSKYDLMGARSEHLDHWQEGLKFGFSFVVNDGDESAAQLGWGGYYPHAIVTPSAPGTKHPSKTGLVEFAGPDRAPGGGGGGGWFWPFFWGVVLTVGALYAREHVKKNGVVMPSMPSMPAGMPGRRRRQRRGRGGRAPVLRARRGGRRAHRHRRR